MKHRHLTLMHGGACPCRRCRLERYALLACVLLAGFALATLGFWLDAQWVRWVVGR